MKYIIQRLAVELVNGWIDSIAKEGFSNLDKLVFSLLKINNSVATDLVSQLLERLDKDIHKAEDVRDELGLKVKQRGRSREYMTELGSLKYSRTYYYNEFEERHLYPIDEIVGISKYARLSPGVSAALVNSAVEVSMRKSSKNVTNGEISAQTVCNKVHDVGVLENELPVIRREVEELHIFADEDHGSLQNGKCESVPLVSICEGIQQVGKNRNATINCAHFTSDMSDTDELWRKVYAYAHKVYDLEKVTKICIHGDGGQWIQKGSL